MLSAPGSSFIAASRALGSNLSAVSCWSSLSLSYLVSKKGLAYCPSGRIRWRALSSGHNGWHIAATEQGISLAFFVCSLLPLETSIFLHPAALQTSVQSSLIPLWLYVTAYPTVPLCWSTRLALASSARSHSFSVWPIWSPVRLFQLVCRLPKRLYLTSSSQNHYLHLTTVISQVGDYSVPTRHYK